MNVPLIAGVSELAGRYDAFLIDAWGVIHDGRTIYPGALECLAALRAADKRLVMISNASRRSAVVADEIVSLGVPAGIFDAVVTSGEGCWQAANSGRFGRRCYYLGPDYSLNLFDGLGVDRVTELAQADFLLVAGMVQRTDRPEFYDGLLREALDAGLDLVCANSDIEVIHSGERRFSGGSVAQRYAALGGRIHLFGKPHRAIYEACLDAVGQIPRARVLMVGDSFDTDIPGALDAGIDALFIAGGIHAEALGGAPFTAEGLESFYTRRQRYPTAALDALRW